MTNAAGVVASLLSEDDANNPAIVQLTFRVAAPDRPPRDAPFGGEPKQRDEPEIIDLVDGLREMLEKQGFTHAGESTHAVQ